MKTEPVEIPIDIIDKATAEAKQIQASMDRLSQKAKEAGVSQTALNKALANTTAQRPAFTFTELSSAINVATTAFKEIYGAVSATYNAFQDYAQQVRDISAISGEGAVESSKLLQVLDDYQISADDITASMRAMTKEGLVPTVDTLAKLSDQYLSITDAQERNEFVIKNLGRSGLAWVNVLKQGSAALKASEKDINKNLILTDEQIKNAEEQRLAMDALSDSWEGFKVSIGSAIGDMILAQQNTQNMTRDLAELYGMSEGQFRRAMTNNRNFASEVKATEAQLKRGAAATEFWSRRLQDNADIIDAETIPSLEDMNKKYQDHINMVETISDEEKTMADGMADVAKERAAVEAEMQEAIAQGWWVGSEKVQGYMDKLAELSSKEDEYTEQYEDNKNRRILAGLEENLAKDGWTEAEIKYYEETGLAMGIFTESAIKEAEETRKAIEDLTVTFENLPTEKEIQINVMTNYASDTTAEDIISQYAPGYSKGTDGWQTVPSGYNNDAYPIMLSSGERFSVIPQNQSASPASPAGGGGDTSIIPILKQFADEIARANRSAFEKAGRR